MIFEIVLIVIIIFSIILHEVAHGYSAYILGDNTAKNEGRLTLNPIPHIDVLGTLILPALLIFTGSSFLFGWAKPVPYNVYNLKGRWGETFVASAGCITNFLIALIFALIYRFTIGEVSSIFSQLFQLVVFINIFLAILNLIPIPPLDGAKIVSSIMPVNIRLKLEEKLKSFININSIVFLILVLLFIIFVLLDYIVLLVRTVSTVFLGTPI